MADVKPQHYGSTRRGLGEWLLQRLTAVYMAGFAVYFILRLWLRPFPDHASWYGYVQAPVVQLGLVTFWLAAALHAWIGLRSVVMDYVRPLWLRLTLLALMGVGLVFLTLWAVITLIAGAAG